MLGSGFHAALATCTDARCRRHCPSFHLSLRLQDPRGNGGLRRGLTRSRVLWTAGILAGSVCCGRRQRQLWDFTVHQDQAGFPSRWIFPRVSTMRSHARPWSQAASSSATKHTGLGFRISSLYLPTSVMQNSKHDTIQMGGHPV